MMDDKARQGMILLLRQTREAMRAEAAHLMRRADEIERDMMRLRGHKLVRDQRTDGQLP